MTRTLEHVRQEIQSTVQLHARAGEQIPFELLQLELLAHIAKELANIKQAIAQAPHDMPRPK